MTSDMLVCCPISEYCENFSVGVCCCCRSFLEAYDDYFYDTSDVNCKKFGKSDLLYLLSLSFCVPENGSRVRKGIVVQRRRTKRASERNSDGEVVERW